MLTDGKNGLVNLQFEDLCNSDCSVRARLLRSLEQVRITTPLLWNVSCFHGPLALGISPCNFCDR